MPDKYARMLTNAGPVLARHAEEIAGLAEEKRMEMHPKWRQDRCELCKAGVPLLGWPGLHAWEGGGKRCTAPSEAEHIAELEGMLERARVDDRFSAQACPLCEYKAGVFIRRCSMHQEISELKAERDEARAALRQVDDVLAVNGLGAKDGDYKTALHDLVTWEIQIHDDPLVSESAKKRVEVIAAARDVLVDLLAPVRTIAIKRLEAALAALETKCQHESD